jgi:hypothetical protein
MQHSTPAVASLLSPDAGAPNGRLRLSPIPIGGAGPDRSVGDNDAGGCGPIIGSIQSGSDTIEARDGERDVIDCGVGNDTTRVDAGDVVRETVETGGSPSGGGSGGDGSGGGGSIGDRAVGLRLPNRLAADAGRARIRLATITNSSLC